MNNAIINLSNVSKIYKRGAEDVYALNGVSLSVAEGEYLAIAGPSGSGKTTMLNIVGCLDLPTEGVVTINGRTTEAMKEKDLVKIRKKTIGFVFQQFFLIPTLTVLENVQLPALFFGKNGTGEKAKELIEIVGLTKRINHLPSQLSGGEMQRVAIARSLINSPPVLLADEPTGNLDTKNASVIMNLFEELNKNGLTIVVVTHNNDLVKRCSRMVSIEDGKIKNN